MLQIKSDEYILCSTDNVVVSQPNVGGDSVKAMEAAIQSEQIARLYLTQ